MKGKKTDPAFVSSFIQECVQSGFETPEQITKYAKHLINQIDEDIKAIERKKIKRSKLLDVVASFEQPKKDKSEDAKYLSFFELKYPEACHHLCDLLGKLPSISTNLSGEVPPDVRFSIKQMLESKIIERLGDQLVRGERFDEYVNFLFPEDQ